jgi:hypothetical protein
MWGPDQKFQRQHQGWGGATSAMLVWRVIPKMVWSQTPMGGQWRCPLARLPGAPSISMMPLTAASPPVALARSAEPHRRRAGIPFYLMPLREQHRAHSTPGKSHHAPRVPFTCHGSNEGCRSDGGPAAGSTGRAHGRRGRYFVPAAFARARFTHSAGIAAMTRAEASRSACCSLLLQSHQW